MLVGRMLFRVNVLITQLPPVVVAALSFPVESLYSDVCQLYVPAVAQVRLKFSASLQRADACRELLNLASDVPPQLLLAGTPKVFKGSCKLTQI